MTFGDRLLRCMKESGITQKQMAEKVGATPTQLNYWIKNKRQPDIPYIRNLAIALNVSADYLIGNAAFAEKKPTSPSAEALAIAIIYDLLTDAGKELLGQTAAFAEKNFKKS